jgi:hypothetical protein
MKEGGLKEGAEGFNRAEVNSSRQIKDGSISVT